MIYPGWLAKGFNLHAGKEAPSDHVSVKIHRMVCFGLAIIRQFAPGCGARKIAGEEVTVRHEIEGGNQEGGLDNGNRMFAYDADQALSGEVQTGLACVPSRNPGDHLLDTNIRTSASVFRMARSLTGRERINHLPERNLLYVAITRATGGLTLLLPETMQPWVESPWAETQ